MATRPRGWGGDSCDALAPASLARICKPAKESPIAAPLLQANISGKDIPDAAASLRYRRPSLAGSRQSGWCACDRVRLTEKRCAAGRGVDSGSSLADYT
ncbi:MAG: hypothetical protein ACLSFB_08390 [[Clostridium] scindens]|uniref:hypothetical protein n=1 Tax=Clostridium scindens (strain JCM 10418 / VPI 12708) TaxID=29347 RepID=UPI0026EED2FE|nr:hypothetical protein [[Clostridium] scindens]